MQFKTIKLYQESPWSTRASTAWAKRGLQLIAVEKSIAFAEAGGQLGDQGIIVQNGRQVQFQDTQKNGVGRCVVRQDFPLIQVEQEINLLLTGEVPSDWDETLPIEIVIDKKNRAELTRSHTAAHLVFIALGQIFGDLSGKVKGCRIEQNKGRFDLTIPKTNEAVLHQLEEIVRQWVEADYQIEIEALPGEPECRIWIANGVRIPCGGSHLCSTAAVGQITVSRKSKGPRLERIIYHLYGPVSPEIVAMYD